MESEFGVLEEKVCHCEQNMKDEHRWKEGNSNCCNRFTQMIHYHFVYFAYSSINTYSLVFCWVMDRLECAVEVARE